MDSAWPTTGARGAACRPRAPRGCAAGPARSGRVSRTPRRLVSRAAFTLLELLLVIVILGIVTAVVVPQFGAAMTGGQLRVAARAVVQASRYARTMALLHQLETDLVLDLQQGRVRVVAAPVSGEHRSVGADMDNAGLLAAGLLGETAASGETPTVAPAADTLAGMGVVVTTNRATLAAQSLSDEIQSEFVCEGNTFAFLGYTEDSAAVSPQEEGQVRIRFRSNGTCRPFRVRVQTSEADWLDIAIDITGAAQVGEPST